MVKVESGNVLLKPSHRKHLMAQLRRAIHLAQRMGDMVLTIHLHRTGKTVEARASVAGKSMQIDCRSRTHDWREAVRRVVLEVSARLHEARVQQLRPA